MIKHHSRLLGIGLFAYGLLGAHGAYGASTEALDITATINPTTQCTPDLKGTTIDYGDISVHALNKDKPTALRTQEMTLAVNCAPFASKYALRIIDLAPNQGYWPTDDNGVPIIPDLGSVVNAASYQKGLGLGTKSNHPNLGMLFLRGYAPQADGKPARFLYRSTTPAELVKSWRPYDTHHNVPILSPINSGFVTFEYAVGDSTGYRVAVAKNSTLRIETRPVIDSNALKDIKGDVYIDSKFAIEINQL